MLEIIKYFYRPIKSLSAISQYEFNYNYSRVHYTMNTIKIIHKNVHNELHEIQVIINIHKEHMFTYTCIIL